MDMKLERITDMENEEEINRSVSFIAQIEDIRAVFVIRGNITAVKRLLSNLGVNEVGDIIEVKLEKNKQQKL